MGAGVALLVTILLPRSRSNSRSTEPAVPRPSSGATPPGSWLPSSSLQGSSLLGSSPSRAESLTAESSVASSRVAARFLGADVAPRVTRPTVVRPGSSETGPSAQFLRAPGQPVSLDELEQAEWVAADPHCSRRASHQRAIALPGNLLFVVGGEGKRADPELYDLGSNAWRATSSAPGLFQTGVQLSDGRVLSVGEAPIKDFHEFGREPDRSAIYDPKANSWTTAVALTSTHGGDCAMALLSDGRALCAGGAGPSELLDGGEATDETDLYDPATRAWSRGPKMHEARIAHTATALPDGRIMVTGGWRFDGETLNSVEFYDSARNAWDFGPPLRNARSYHTATLLGRSAVLVVGGLKSGDTTGVEGTEIFDLQTGQWRSGPRIGPRSGHAATAFGDDHAVVVGGFSNDKHLQEAWLFSLRKGTWSRLSDLPKGRDAHTANLLSPDNIVAVVGGFEAARGDRACGPLLLMPKRLLPEHAPATP